MYADKGLAVLLLAISATLAFRTGWPRSKQDRTYRPNMGPRQLIKHVMMNEAQWANVLKEKVKMLGDPPYGGSLNYGNDDKGPSIQTLPKSKPVVEQGDDEKKEIADIDGTMTSYTVGDIVATVSRHFIRVRSFVEYGMEALRLATSCYVMRQLMMQFSNISLMMAKEDSVLDVMAAVKALQNNATSYINLLAFWPNNDITVLYNFYWEAFEVIQDNRVKSLTKTKYELEMIKKLESYSENLQNLVLERCEEVRTQDEILRDMGIEQKPPLLSDSYLDLLVQFKDLKQMSVKQSGYMNWYIKKLKINTMPTRMWSSLFLSKGLLEETRSDLSETTLEVEKELSEEHLTTGETSSGHSIETGATEPSPEVSGLADTTQ